MLMWNVMFSNADDAPEEVSDVFETLIGYKMPADEPNPCNEVARFDDTYIIAVPENHPMLPKVRELSESHDEWVAVEN